jgi:hypothetical protein
MRFPRPALPSAECLWAFLLAFGFMAVGLLAAILPTPASAEVRITIDKADQRMSVAVDGTPRYSWPVSTGVEAYDTPSGTYRPFRMERTHFSREWDDAPMPHAIFFTMQGHAIHATNHTRQLGRPASHGCVRLSPRNAATLFSLVKAQGLGNTRVSIEGSDLLAGRSGGGGTASRGARSYESGGLMSAGMQMGVEAIDGYAPAPRRAYRPAGVTPYGYGYGYGGRGDLD